MNKEQAEEFLLLTVDLQTLFLQVSIKGCESIKYKSYFSVLLNIKK